MLGGLMKDSEEIPTVKTRDQAEAAMAIIRATSVQLGDLEVRRNVALMAAQTNDPKMDLLTKRINKFRDALRLWANTDRKNWGEQKYLDLRHGRIAFREGRPAVAFIKGWDEKQTLARLLELGGRFMSYVRKKFELDKSSVLRDVKLEAGEARLTESQLRDMGLAVEQTESFLCEPKLECLAP